MALLSSSQTVIGLTPSLWGFRRFRQEELHVEQPTVSLHSLGSRHTHTIGSEIRVSRGQCDELAFTQTNGYLRRVRQFSIQVNEPISTRLTATGSVCRFESRDKSGTQIQNDCLPGPKPSGCKSWSCVT